jgi:parvulin-like peptidyl-prolyl isomerase
MRWIREPLLHFLLAGLLLFAGYGVLRRDAAPEPTSRRIELTLGDLRQLEIAFTSRWQRPPTPDEMVGMIEAKLREEVLYREALALGLDQEDTIVKRRMAQKMEFLAEDGSAAREPDPDPGELAGWFEQNAQRFALPGRASFRHLYFSPDRRGARARDDAAQARDQIGGQPEDAPAAEAALGDPFMFQGTLVDRTPEQLAKDFGPGFASAVFALTPGSWQGPIESGYGWHLVFVSSLTPGRVPAFEEVEPEVKAAWQDEQRAEAWRRAYEEMRAKYELVLPAPPEAAAR